MCCIPRHTLLALLAAAVSVKFADGLRLPHSNLQVSTEQGTRSHERPYSLVYSVSADQVDAVSAAMRSVIRHTKADVNVYLFILEEDKPQFEKLEKVDGVQINKIYFTKSDVDPYVNKAYKGGSHLDDPHNYVRYIMADKIPEADGMVWMDGDMIATQDIMVDMPEFLQSAKAVGAFRRDWLGVENLSAITAATHLPIQEKGPYFNAGFAYFSAPKFREHSDSLRKIVAANNKHEWWTQLGSQPPLNLLFGGQQLFQLHGIHYVDGLGWREEVDTSQEGLFHWNGPKKPWKEDGQFKDIYEAYTSDKDQGDISNAIPVGVPIEQGTRSDGAPKIPDHD